MNVLNYEDKMQNFFARVRHIAKRGLVSFVMSACPSARMKNLLYKWQKLHQIWFLVLFLKSVEGIPNFIQIASNLIFSSFPKIFRGNSNFHPNLTRIKGTSHRQAFTFMVIFIYSFSSLSYDRSKASSKARSPRSTIYSFLLQSTVSSPFLKVIQ